MTVSIAPQLFGFLNVNKPAGMTAHDVVARVRKIAKIKQVGHGGTLDPMATGVLPIALGKACRLLRFMEGDKTYMAEILFGRQTDTDDITGTTTTDSAKTQTTLPEEQSVLDCLPAFQGKIRQIPPIYSAVHIGGKRLHEMARRGEMIEEIPERNVEIKLFHPISYDKPVLKARIKCSAGTYIRSIARDLGHQLGCGGCLQSLVREESGPFAIEHSYELDELQQAGSEDRLEQLIVPPDKVLTIEQISVTDEQAARLRMGQTIMTDEAGVPGSADASVIAMHSNKLVAICKASRADFDAPRKLQPEVVIL